MNRGLNRGRNRGESRGLKRSTEYGLQSTEGTGWLEYSWLGEGRGVASPRPTWLGGQGEALPLPAGGAREIGQHVVLSLPEAKGGPGTGMLVSGWSRL